MYICMYFFVGILAGQNDICYFDLFCKVFALHCSLFALHVCIYIYIHTVFARTSMQFALHLFVHCMFACPGHVYVCMHVRIYLCKFTHMYISLADNLVSPSHLFS